MDSFDSFESPFRRAEDSQIKVKMKCSASADYAQSGHEIPTNFKRISDVCLTKMNVNRNKVICLGCSQRLQPLWQSKDATQPIAC